MALSPSRTTCGSLLLDLQSLNVVDNDEIIADGLSEEPQCEPKNPVTPYTTYGNELFTSARTILDNFAALSATLKSSLVQEYVDFLNRANRNELLATKGIGGKIADYIIELRETSPLKSLSDLEKLGLSSKQVNIMFTKAATCFLDGQEDELSAEPNSPVTPYATRYGNELFTEGSSPFALPATLKSFLMKEYVDFLNRASREELLEMKGISLNAAKYIIELRETSPLKSLSDLEKVGLSSKQVHGMFSKAAREFF